jgi:hypothetical protein
MANGEMGMATQRKIKVGDEWPGGIAHRWRVVEIKPFGKAEIRSVNEDGSLGFKFGEMRHCDIRAILDAQVSA